MSGMGSRIACFWLTPTDTYEVGLRRFAYGERPECRCGTRAHDAYVPIGREHYAEQPTTGDFGVPHDDPRWPKVCTRCGFVFLEDDHWQVCYHQFYRRGDTGDLTTLPAAPPGAMWNAEYLLPDYAGPDGQSLVLRTPGGDWLIDRDPDGRKGVGGWKRTGTPPRITVRPSILFTGETGYHGFLTDGVLEEC